MRKYLTSTGVELLVIEELYPSGGVSGAVAASAVSEEARFGALINRLAGDFVSPIRFSDARTHPKLQLHRRPSVEEEEVAAPSVPDPRLSEAVVLALKRVEEECLRLVRRGRSVSAELVREAADSVFGAGTDVSAVRPGESVFVIVPPGHDATPEKAVRGTLSGLILKIGS